MSKLIITRGLPASGKTSWARKQQEANEGMWRINRDDLRRMVLPTWSHGDTTSEDMLTSIQLAAVGILLDDNFDVIVDDTNLWPEAVRQLEMVAADVNAEVHIEDSFLNVHVEECVRRDMWRREGHVGEAVIRGMHAKYLAPQASA